MYMPSAHLARRDMFLKRTRLRHSFLMELWVANIINVVLNPSIVSETVNMYMPSAHLARRDLFFKTNQVLCCTHTTLTVESSHRSASIDCHGFGPSQWQLRDPLPLLQVNYGKVSLSRRPNCR